MESSSDLKHLVIVGASFAGVSLCLNVGSAFRITLIDRKEFYEWVTAVPKSIVNRAGYFDEEATINYNQMVNVNKVLGPNVTFVQADLTELVDESSLKIKRITEGTAGKEEELSFDFLTLCTGAIYSINETPQSIAKIYTKDARSSLFEKYREHIEEAESVLVVGGGATGLEMSSIIGSKAWVQGAYFAFLTNQPDGGEKVGQVVQWVTNALQTINAEGSACSDRSVKEKRKAHLDKIFGRS